MSVALPARALRTAVVLTITTLVACSSKPPAATAQGQDDRAGARADLRELVARYEADRGSLGRTYRVELSSARLERLKQLASDWERELAALDFEALDQDGRIDWILLRREVRHDREQLELQAARLAEMQALVPFVETVAGLTEARRKLEAPAAEQAAGTLHALAKEVDELEKKLGEKEQAAAHKPSVGLRARDAVDDLRRDLGDWYRFGQGYDPLFEWWCAKPHEAAEKALERYAKTLAKKVGGLEEDDTKTIVGDPIGREALVTALANAWIPYTPEELIQIAEREFAWCATEMRAAAQALGCGDDWKKALEQVKALHVGPGEQPVLIRDLAREAVEFLEARELVTVPALAKETWRMEMMSVERQLVTPFFTGGEVVSVSYPTDSMTHEEKLMTMRGNNRHFSRAVVHHEVIPGHHLQQFMTARHFPYRRAFSTPFWTEGWALYWELQLWDQGFPRGPEDKIGMLFWRMHRCARIRFSLGFHLGQLTPEQCIDMLVNEVGHERDNATGEVRRSFNGSYEPLYQCAYMLGALQFRALYRELVESGKATPRQFHDTVLQSGNMPVELVRARLTQQPLTRDFATSWRFYPLER